MRIMYDILFLIFAVFYLPYFIVKRKYHRDFLQRLGIFKGDIFSRIAAARPIWVHAVSVGEMKTAESLISKMRDIFPSKRFVISNVTTTGHDVAVSVARENDVVIYFPIDLSFVIRRMVSLLNPSLFILIETEIWPNLITELHTKNIPVVLMNGRISERSFRNYYFAKPIIAPILKKISLFCMRTKEDAERIRKLGIPDDRIKVTGNMKFDAVAKDGISEGQQWPLIRNKTTWLPESSDLIIAGSTHRGEDEEILQSYKVLKRYFSNLRLLIAPRHIERVKEIRTLVKQAGLKAIGISEVETKCTAADSAAAAGYDENSVFILDSTGRLSSLYRLATVVFMGGSLVPHGGHNFIEPAVWSKPIITGPHVHNFKDMSELFARNGAIIIIHDEGELAKSLQTLLSDKNKCRTMGERAKKVVFDNIGSTDRNISLIRQFIQRSPTA